MPKDVASMTKANGCPAAVNAALDFVETVALKRSGRADDWREDSLDGPEREAYYAALRVLTAYFNQGRKDEQT